MVISFGKYLFWKNLKHCHLTWPLPALCCALPCLMRNCVLWHFTTGLDIAVVLEGVVNSFCCVMAGDEEGNAVYHFILTLSVGSVASCGGWVCGGFPLALQSVLSPWTCPWQGSSAKLRETQSLIGRTYIFCISFDRSQQRKHVQRTSSEKKNKKRRLRWRWLYSCRCPAFFIMSSLYFLFLIIGMTLPTWE